MPAMKNKQVAEWIGKCAIYALASRSEAMGRVLIEAAAAGKPRVAARVDGTYTMVEDGKDGILFEKGNAAALAAALRRLMADPQLRRQLGQAARARALRDFSAGRYADCVTDLVGAVLRSAELRR
jgi:glycosyltransferase involved in cell wall biosynthesis